MKRFLLAVAILMLASTAMASGSDPVLTSDGVLYTVATNEAENSLVVTARYNTVRESEVVPGTEDAVVDADAHLAYDRMTQTLFVVWRRGESSTDVVFQALDRNGQWSARTVLASAPGFTHSDLRVLLTRTTSLQNETITLLHAIWWKEASGQLSAEYGLAAIKGTTVYSTHVADLLQLANIRSALDSASSDDGVTVRPELVPTYPPLAIAAATDGVDVVFGEKDRKAVTRVTIQPRQIGADARLYIPGGKGATRAPYVKVHNAMNGQVETYISGGRVVFYSSAAQFRYTTLENGSWTAVRSIPLDGVITPEQIANELRRTAQEQQ